MKKILMSTCIASSLLVYGIEGIASPGVKLKINGCVDVMYGVRSGNYNIEGTGEKLSIYNASGDDGELNKSAVAGNAIINIGVEGYKSENLQYYGNMELYGNTSSADYMVDVKEDNVTNDARARQVFIGAKGKKWGEFSIGSMQSITKSFKNGVSLPWMASDRLQYWLPSYYKLHSTDRNKESIDRRFMVEGEMYGNNMFFTHLNLTMHDRSSK